MGRKFGYGSKDQVKRHEKNLELMAAYCNNNEKCRRNVLLEHFGEVPSLERMCGQEGSELCDICRRRKKQCAVCEKQCSKRKMEITSSYLSLLYHE